MMDEAAEAGHRFLAYFAFPRCGKSFGAAKHASLDLLVPDHHMWIVAPTYPLGSKEFMYLWADLLEQGILQWADKKHGGSRSSDIRSGNMFIRLPWGAFVEVKSGDNPSGLRAEEPDTLILAEASALNPDIYHRHLWARTQKRKGKVIVPTTPMGKNWIFDEFRVRSKKRDPQGRDNPLYDPLYWSCCVSADPDLIDENDWDMPDTLELDVYDQETVQRAKQTLPWPVYIEQFGGGFASYAGRVLSFDPRIHRCAPFKIPDHWTHIVGWDHGADPGKTAILIGSYAPDSHLYWWAELYEAGWTVQRYWEWVKRTLGPNKAVSLVAVDPSAKQIRIELANLAPPVASNIPHDKQIISGVLRLSQLLNLQQMSFFAGACPNWEREALRMEWDEKNPKKILNDHVYHAISATRYATLITVPLPTDPIGPAITVAREDDEEEYWRQVRKLKDEQFWKQHRKRYDREITVNQLNEWEEMIHSDAFDEVISPIDVVDSFDLESYLD